MCAPWWMSTAMPRNEVPSSEAWQPLTPQGVSALIDRISVPWCIVGGWAIDLFLDAETRTHADIEIEILRSDFDAVRRRLKSHFHFFAAGSGNLTPLDIMEKPALDIHQVWCADLPRMAWKLDIMFGEGDADVWRYRRNPAIERSRTLMTLETRERIPFLNPAGVLLFKAKHMREKDIVDFGNVLPRMTAQDRAWLGCSLEKAHPGHAWIERIAEV
jgi:hypothetical protein